MQLEAETVLLSLQKEGRFFSLGIIILGIGTHNPIFFPVKISASITRSPRFCAIVEADILI